MSEAEESLRSCPFCGSGTKPTIFDFDGEPYVPGFEVRCDASGWEGMDERGCGATSGWGETRAEAIAHWNRRALDTEEKGWQTIETAPKDGTKVLLHTSWAGDEIATDPFDEVQVGYWDEGNITGDIWHREPGWSCETIGEAMHWQPLRKPPLDTEKTV